MTSRSRRQRCSTTTRGSSFNTRDGRLLWAAYPSSDAQTNGLIRVLTENGAVVDVDQQASKPTRQILVQFLIPILLLVCLFAYFTRIGGDGGTSGYAAFSKWAGKGRKANGQGV